MRARLASALCWSLAWAGCEPPATGAGPDGAAPDAGPPDVVAEVGADAFAAARRCSAAGRTLCGERCVDTLYDAAHCGGCGRACPAGARCLQGVCRCAGAVCGDQCVDPMTSASHCGACGRACAGELVCREGSCACPLETCAGGCVDTRTDPSHCGGCGRACAATERCTAGACGCTVEGRGSCEGAPCSTDLSRDARHCGTCGLACEPDQRCEEGRCADLCPRGAADCDRDGVCETFPAASASHCGACGNACGAGRRCLAGRCAPTAVEPRMPGSGLVATSARPWFRWALADGADGARVQVCADRACSTVEWQADAVGTSARPAMALAAGIHFWRLFARRGAAVDAAAGATWEFLVPAAPAAWEVASAGLMDLDGDGREDRVVVDASTPAVLRVVYGGGSRADSVHRLPRAGDLRLAITGYSAATPIAAGDLDGDGYADLVTWHTTVTRYGTVRAAPGYMHVVFYGSAEGLTDRTAILGTGPSFGSSGVFELAGFAAVGSFRGGPGGDVAIATRRVGFIESCVAALAATATAGGAGWSGACDAVTFAAGAYDADGRVDVAVWPPALVYTSGATARDVGRCADFLWGARGEVVRAADVDGDGYDDLVRTEAGASVVMYGGPGGLDGSRCAALP